ncbi:mitochondrial outer membrane protein mmm1 [Ophiostoma piceae UAMH 11346]|uniref:Maintenance of mitochondrial morphology protein 1 n=1 Tax=Ophiostoma piceae (strain UAMH 11346) TaxID=1262450 RepID=S3CLA9_OPHP1|nr:mitochondrial outer membrane protein mmm1 [Ophiostoma piceae UAMH 11346]
MDLNTCPPRVEPTFSFTQGLIVGQLSVVLLVAAFIKFFIFGDPPSPEATASQRASERRSRTEAHKKSLLTLRASQLENNNGNNTQSPSHSQRNGNDYLHAAPLSSSPPSFPAGSAAAATASANTHPSIKDLKDRRKPSSVLRRPPVLTISSILNKTYYRVDSHQPESLDWFNVLIAQTIAQFRNDAQHDDAILTSLTKALNGTSRPDFVDEIRVTELSLGEDFPIFSNCRIIPVDEDGLGFTSTSTHAHPNTGGGFGGMGGMGGGTSAAGATRLQARMDVDLSDMITLAVETKLLMNYPRRLSAVLPVALAVSVVRFSGTLSVSFVPSNPSQGTPTKMIFAFLDDYRLDFSIRSLLGSRSRLQDVPKIAQLIESRLHRWFDERAVEPRFQEIELPSLWPRMKNARGGSGGGGPPSEDVSMSDGAAGGGGSGGGSKVKPATAPGLDALRQGRPESRDSRDSGATNNTRDPRREAETENWVERQVPLTAAGAVAAASSVPHHMHSLSSASQTTQAQPIPQQSSHHLRPSQDSLRYRRRSRPDDAFSMPGSLPDMSIG